jgi:hypothetical protein
MDWDTVKSDPRFISLDNEKKMSVARNFFNDFYAKDERYVGLDQRKKDTIKNKFYASAVETFPSDVEDKSAYDLGLKRIAEVGTQAMRTAPVPQEQLGIAGRDEQIIGDISTRVAPSKPRAKRAHVDITAPMRAVTQLAGEIVGLDPHTRVTREEAEALWKKGEYKEYARATAGNIMKGMASVPEIMINAPLAISETLIKGGEKMIGDAPEGMDRTEVIKETAKETAGVLFGWLEDIADDPIRFAFERPEDVYFALKIAQGAVKGTVKGIDVVEGVKARQGAVSSIREAFKPTKAVAEKFIEKPTKKPKPHPVKTDIVPDPVTEGGFVKVPKVEDIANAALWMKENTKNAYRSFKEFFVPLSSVKSSELFLKLRYKHLGALDRLESRVLTEHKRLAELGPEENLRMFKVLDGQIPFDLDPQFGGLSNKGRHAVRRIRKFSDKAWDGYLDRGIIDLNTYNKHKGSYIKYMYLKHIVGDKASVPGTPSGKMDLSQLKARMDLTPEQRKAIGWVEDASIAGPVGVAQSWGDLMKYDYLSKIAENPDWVWEPSVVKIQTNMVNKAGQRITKKMSIHELAEEAKVAKRVSEAAPNNLEARQYAKRLNKKLDKLKADTGNVPKDYVQMPNDIKYGPLRGAYIRKPIAQDLMPVVSITDATMGSHLVAGAIRANQKLMSAFKVGKVALNPPTIIRNVGSNIVQANLSGVPLWEVPQYISGGLKHIFKKDALWGQARRHGIFKTNWGQAEIGEILGDLKKLEKKPYPNLLVGLQKIAEQYGKIDDFYKMAKFAERVRKGDSYAKAALEAQKWHMDYSLATPAIKVARANVAPFVTYQYKVLPLLMEAAAKRPWVYAKYAMIPWVATQALLASTDLTKEDFEKLRKDLPTYLKNSGTAMPVPWRSPEGDVQWMNYEYFMPFGNAWTLAEDMKSFGAVSPEASGPGDILRAIGIGNPIVDTVYGSLMMAKGTEPPKDTFTKRSVYNRLDDPAVKMQKMMYWLYTKWAPGAFTKEGALGYTARVGKEDRYGRTVTPGQAAGRWFGLNITAPTPEQADNYRKYFVGTLQREVRQAMKNPEVSDEEVQAMQENLDKMLDELYK